MHCLHGRGFICNRIGFDAVTHFVYTAPVQFVTRTVLNTLSKITPEEGTPRKIG